MSERSVRVYMIGWEYPPHISGGLGIACRGMARALAARGHKISFLLPNAELAEESHPNIDLFDVQSRLELLTPGEVARLREISSTLQSPELIEAVYGSAAYHPASEVVTSSWSQTFRSTGESVRTLLKGGYSSRIYQEVQAYAEIAAMLARHIEHDVIHAHDWMTYPAAQAAALVSGKPLVLHVHATEYDRSGENMNRHVYELERRAYNKCQQIVTVSRYTANILKERYHIDSGRITVVYNGIDFSENLLYNNGHVHKKARDKIVLFLGRITFQKGPDYFIQAARLVTEKMKNVRFVMAGTGDMYRRMIEMAAEMGLGKYFHYTGPLSREDVQRIYKMSDLYIMPSVSEPFGIAPLEAISHGVPTIVSKQSGVSEVLSSALKVNFWDVRELAEKILFVLQDNTLVEHLKSESMDEARSITWERCAASLEDIYYDLSGG